MESKNSNAEKYDDTFRSRLSLYKPDVGAHDIASEGAWYYAPCPVILDPAIITTTSRYGHPVTPTTPPIININATSQNQQFSAYPNPTSGVVTFSYNVPDGTDGITIVVTNIVGEQVAQIQTANNTGSSYWDPRNLASGVYIYQASDAKGMISKGKIVVE